MNKKVVILWAGGHAKSIADIILKCNDEVLEFNANTPYEA